jgi:hypothetical protein
MHPVIIAFVAFWFGLLVAGIAMRAISGDRRSIGALVFPLTVGAALVGFGRFAARNEPQLLLDFMREVIAAREA